MGKFQFQFHPFAVYPAGCRRLFTVHPASGLWVLPPDVADLLFLQVLLEGLADADLGPLVHLSHPQAAPAYPALPDVASENEELVGSKPHQH